MGDGCTITTWKGAHGARRRLKRVDGANGVANGVNKLCDVCCGRG